MHICEIRILRSNGSTDTILKVMHLNDTVVVRPARKFAEARPFEVWRDMDCIYGRASSPSAQSGHCLSRAYLRPPLKYPSGKGGVAGRSKRRDAWPPKGASAARPVRLGQPIGYPSGSLPTNSMPIPSSW
jgi:hypothetical protein